MMTRKLVLLTLLLCGVLDCRPDAVEINVRFARISGLAKGDRVLFEKTAAGSVESIQYTPDGSFVVGVRVNGGFADALTEYSQFYLIQDPARPDRKAVEIRLTRQGGRLLSDGASVAGITESEEMVSQWQKTLEEGLHFFEKQIEKYGQDIEKIPESEEYQQLKRSLKDWAAEMEAAGQDARERLEKQWLPQIEKQLEEFRKWLREQGREKKIKPLEEEVERIREI